MRASKNFGLASIPIAVAIVAAFPLAPARASNTFVEAIADISAGLSDPFDVEHDNTGTPSASASAGMAGAFATAQGSMSGPGEWSVGAHAAATGSTEHRGASALAVVSLTTDFLITVTGKHFGDRISYFSQVHVHGAVSGNSASPGNFDVSIDASIETHDLAGQLLGTGFAAEQTLSTNEGFTGAELPSTISFQLFTNIGDQFRERAKFEAFANTFTVEDQGFAQADASFDDTFTWGGITDAFDITTGEPIALSDIHLIDADDGFDWAQPAIISEPTPEPATLSVVAVALVAFLARRRRPKARPHA